MRNNQRYAVIFATFIIMVFLALSFSSSASTQSRKKSTAAKKRAGDPRQAVEHSVKRMQKKSADPKAKSSILIVEDEEVNEAEDPDLPPWMAGKIDKEAYLRLRGDNIDMLRGRPINLPGDPREKAIQQMEKQELQVRERAARGLASPLNTSNWVFLGPAPIPLGQTSATRVPVSGRTIAIAIHPTDPDTVYVGTAQGGLYKSTNGGANWAKLFEFQLESLAIGAIAIDPIDSSIVYVGTGEPNLSADSFAGRGLYIIRNANSPSPTLNGPFRLNSEQQRYFYGPRHRSHSRQPARQQRHIPLHDVRHGRQPEHDDHGASAARHISLDQRPIGHAYFFAGPGDGHSDA